MTSRAAAARASGVGAVAVLFAFTACSRGTEAGAAAPSESLEAEIRSFLAEFRTAFDEGDAERIRALYVADDRFRWLEDGEARYTSVDEILAGLASLPPGVRIETEYAPPRITVLSGALATVQSGFASTFGDPAQGGFAYSGVTSMVLEKSDGAWRIVSGHTSSVRARAWDGGAE